MRFSSGASSRARNANPRPSGRQANDSTPCFALVMRAGSPPSSRRTYSCGCGSSLSPGSLGGVPTYAMRSPEGDQRGEATSSRSWTSVRVAPVRTSASTSSLANSFFAKSGRRVMNTTRLPSGAICGSSSVTSLRRSLSCSGGRCGGVAAAAVMAPSENQRLAAAVGARESRAPSGPCAVVIGGDDDGPSACGGNDAGPATSATRTTAAAIAKRVFACIISSIGRTSRSTGVRRFRGRRDRWESVPCAGRRRTSPSGGGRAARGRARTTVRSERAGRRCR